MGIDEEESENFECARKGDRERQNVSHCHNALFHDSSTAIANAVATRARGVHKAKVKPLALGCIHVNEWLTVFDLPYALRVGNGKALVFAFCLNEWELTVGRMRVKRIIPFSSTTPALIVTGVCMSDSATV